MSVISVSCISRDNYSYELETSQLLYSMNNVVTFRLWIGYSYFNLDGSNLNIYKTLKCRKISKLDNDIISKWHCRLNHVGIMCIHSDETQSL